jgi:hypothetical protein
MNNKIEILEDYIGQVFELLELMKTALEKHAFYSYSEDAINEITNGREKVKKLIRELKDERKN